MELLLILLIFSAIAFSILFISFGIIILSRRNFITTYITTQEICVFYIFTMSLVNVYTIDIEELIFRIVTLLVLLTYVIYTRINNYKLCVFNCKAKMLKNILEQVLKGLEIKYKSEYNSLIVLESDVKIDLVDDTFIIKNYKHLKEFDSFIDKIKESLNEGQLRKRRIYSIIYFLGGISSILLTWIELVRLMKLLNLWS